MRSLRSLILLAMLMSMASCARKVPCEGDMLGASSPLRVQVAEEPVSHRHIRIAIDPGHGGKDTGTQSLDVPVYEEKYLVLATALMLEKHLKRLGYSPFLTRSSDVFVPLPRRVELADQEEADLFVSVHYNAAPSRTAHGVEVYYFKSEANQVRSADSKHLASQVLERVCQQTEARSRGVKHGNFLVIRNAKVPAILVEGGFLSNKSEMDKLANPEYLNKVAWGIARGIDDYLIGIR